MKITLPDVRHRFSFHDSDLGPVYIFKRFSFQHVDQNLHTLGTHFLGVSGYAGQKFFVLVPDICPVNAHYGNIFGNPSSKFLQLLDKSMGQIIIKT